MRDNKSISTGYRFPIVSQKFEGEKPPAFIENKSFYTRDFRERDICSTLGGAEMKFPILIGIFVAGM